MRKADFPILNQKSKPVVYLDSAASSQMPKQVIAAMVKYYERQHANVHRGVYDLSQQATDLYEDAHKAVASLIHAASWQEIVFTKNATESVNLLAYTLGGKLQPGDEIVLTILEHHSNLVPWQEAAKRVGAVLKYIPLTKTRVLDLEKAAKLITKKTKIIAF